MTSLQINLYSKAQGVAKKNIYVCIYLFGLTFSLVTLSSWDFFPIYYPIFFKHLPCSLFALERSLPRHLLFIILKDAFNIQGPSQEGGMGVIPLLPPTPHSLLNKTCQLGKLPVWKQPLWPPLWKNFFATPFKVFMKICCHQINRKYVSKFVQIETLYWIIFSGEFWSNRRC